MRFFVPTANDPAHARMLYDRIRERVASGGHLVDPERIFRIRVNRNGRASSLAVGDSYKELGGDPVFAILRTPSHYVVCTSRHGAMEGEPIQIDRTAVSAMEIFDS